MSEFGTLHMEFAYLSDVTGDPSYKKAVEKVRDAIQSAARPRNLYPNYLNPKTGTYTIVNEISGFTCSQSFQPKVFNIKAR